MGTQLEEEAPWDRCLRVDALSEVRAENGTSTIAEAIVTDSSASIISNTTSARTVFSLRANPSNNRMCHSSTGMAATGREIAEQQPTLL
jgi:hypothetical protein